MKRNFIALALIAAAGANAAELSQRSTLTLEGAQRAIAAAVAQAHRNRAGGVIAVVDDGGNLMALERVDGTFAAGANISIGKARTAALTKQPTKVWEERVKERPAFLNFPAGLAIWGGVPIMYQNECVGAIGVSGVQSQDDEKIALAGTSALE